MKNKQILYISLALIILAAIVRVGPHPYNFTPITAIALFSIFAFKSYWKIIVPFSAIIFSDLLLEILGKTGFHEGTWLVYAGFTLILIVGYYLLKKPSLVNIIGSSVLGSTVFYLLTNFAFFYPEKVADSAIGYPHNWQGIIGSYAAGLPFYRNMIAGDLLYTFLLFGSYFLIKKFVLKTSIAK